MAFSNLKNSFNDRIYIIILLLASRLKYIKLINLTRSGCPMATLLTSYG